MEILTEWTSSLQNYIYGRAHWGSVYGIWSLHECQDELYRLHLAIDRAMHNILPLQQIREMVAGCMSNCELVASRLKQRHQGEYVNWLVDHDMDQDSSIKF